MKLDKNIETKRLEIRSYTVQDKDFCISMWCDEENGRYMSDPVLANANVKYLSYFDSMEDQDDGYYLIAQFKDTRMPVGTCCVFPDENQSYDIGYCINKNYWKMGLGSELIGSVLEWIKVQGGKSVTAEVADDNDGSRALLAKFGFNADHESNFKKWGDETVIKGKLYKLVLLEQND